MREKDPRPKWIRKIQPDRYEPVIIRLSNGHTLTLYIGNGFDGASSFEFTGPQHGIAPVIVKKDYSLVRKALLYYASAETALRLHEGVLSTHYFDTLTARPRKQAPPMFASNSSPYQATYMAGALTRGGRDKCTQHNWKRKTTGGNDPDGAGLIKLNRDFCIYCSKTRAHIKGTPDAARDAYKRHRPYDEGEE